MAGKGRRGALGCNSGCLDRQPQCEFQRTAAASERRRHSALKVQAARPSLPCCAPPTQLVDGGNMRRSTRLRALYTDRRRRNVLFDNLHHREAAPHGSDAELRSGLALLAAAEWCAREAGWRGNGRSAACALQLLQARVSSTRQPCVVLPWRLPLNPAVSCSPRPRRCVAQVLRALGAPAGGGGRLRLAGAAVWGPAGLTAAAAAWTTPTGSSGHVGTSGINRSSG